MRSLFPHQQQALAYAQRRRSIALFMEMRLGKSAVAIRWMCEQTLPQPRRVLVVGPVSVLPGWIDELQLEGVDASRICWLTGPVRERLHRVRTDQSLGYPTWYLLNYEALARAAREFGEIRWDGIILDESTRIRNPKAQTTKLLRKHFGSVPYKAVLSGLPAPESAMDYFSQLAFLHGEFMGAQNFWEWRQRYFYESHWEWLPKKGATQKIQEALRQHAFALTRKEAGLGGRKIYESRYVEMTPPQRRAYHEVRKDFAFKDLLTKWATTRMVWLARIAGGFSPETPSERITDAKIDELVTVLTGELQQESVVVWFRFNAELAAVFHRLRRERVSVTAILGATPPPIRHLRRKAFQAGRVRVLLVQLKCGQYGLDCSRASTAIYFSNSYALEERLQSEARIEHATKHDALLYLDLVTRKTVNEAEVRTLRTKKLTASVFTARLINQLIAVHQESE